MPHNVSTLVELVKSEAYAAELDISEVIQKLKFDAISDVDCEENELQQRLQKLRLLKSKLNKL